MTPKNSYAKEELVACGHGDLFGPGNAQLPTDNMLMVDRIVHISSEGGKHGKGEIIAELDIHPDLWFFSCHFPGDPVMPGCLGLDAMWQAVGFFLAWIGNPGHGRAHPQAAEHAGGDQGQVVRGERRGDRGGGAEEESRGVCRPVAVQSCRARPFQARSLPRVLSWVSSPPYTTTRSPRFRPPPPSRR